MRDSFCRATSGGRDVAFRYNGATLSETVLGKCLKALGAPRDQYIVATKCGRYKEGFDFSAKGITRSIDESLERLQLDYVDILQCHDIEFGSLDQKDRASILDEAANYIRVLQHQVEVERLKKKLRDEENIHRALQRAFNRPLGLGFS